MLYREIVCYDFVEQKPDWRINIGKISLYTKSENTLLQLNRTISKLSLYISSEIKRNY